MARRILRLSRLRARGPSSSLRSFVKANWCSGTRFAVPSGWRESLGQVRIADVVPSEREGREGGVLATPTLARGVADILDRGVVCRKLLEINRRPSLSRAPHPTAISAAREPFSPPLK